MATISTMSMGEKLRFARGEKTLEEVATAVKLTVAMISRLESDDVKPSYDTMQKLSQYYGIPVGNLFF